MENSDMAKKIREEAYKSRKLGELNLDLSYSQAIQRKKEQEYHWKKFNFLKLLNKEMHRIENKKKEENEIE